MHKIQYCNWNTKPAGVLSWSLFFHLKCIYLWVGWDMHSRSYNEFPDPYRSVLGVTVFNSDNEAAIPRGRLSH